MIVKIETSDGVSEYDTNAIKNKDSRVQAEVLVRKVSTLEIQREALQIANVVHRKNLEDICQASPESKIEASSEDE
jgi:hypothetical protein